MVSKPGQPWSRGVAVVLVSCLVLGTEAPRAFAGDGMPDFLSSIFGGAQPQAQPQDQPQDNVRPSRSIRRAHFMEERPLTVKLHRPKVSHFADMPSRPGKVSIFEDKTLRRGDAVMTRHGMRIFAGSNTWPYRDNDFVAIADAGHMDKSVQKTLLSLDSLPRN